MIGTYQRYVISVDAANLRTLDAFGLSNVQLRITKGSSGETLRVGPDHPASPGWPPKPINGPQDEPGVVPKGLRSIGHSSGFLAITGPFSAGRTDPNENDEELIE